MLLAFSNMLRKRDVYSSFALLNDANDWPSPLQMKTFASSRPANYSIPILFSENFWHTGVKNREKRQFIFCYVRESCSPRTKRHRLNFSFRVLISVGYIHVSSKRVPLRPNRRPAFVTGQINRTYIIFRPGIGERTSSQHWIIAQLLDLRRNLLHRVLRGVIQINLKSSTYQARAESTRMSIMDYIG